jgi:putative membrane-bound dehydrogenase-like protein
MHAYSESRLARSHGFSRLRLATASLVAAAIAFSLASLLRTETMLAAEGEQAATFRAGAVASDITPTDFPAIIAGGFLEGRASQVTDRLFARAIVLDDGVTQLALVVVDTCMMPQELIDRAKQLASEQCGIAVDKMMISATHTHSAPAAMGCLGTRQDAAYAAALPGKLAAAIVAAHAQLAPARIGWASVDDWEHTHNRRWIRKPENKIVDPFGQATGRAHMHPGYLSPDVIGPSGPVDPALSVLSIRHRDGRPLAVLANYSQHYFGSPAVSADYYGRFCSHVAALLGQPGDGNGPFVCAMSQGTSGDLMWMDYGAPAKSIGLERYAEAVARYAEKALDQVTYHDTARLALVEKKLPLKYRVPDEQRLAWAGPIAAAIENDLPKSLPEVYAREALILHERQQTELKLQALCIGDLTIATLPNEVYALTGLKLRGRSPSKHHFNIELANGAEGYIPPPEQHVLGGYTTWPARTAGLEVAAETQIVETLVEALEEATGQRRRTLQDEHGPYAEAILAAQPLGYWRLNDEDGSAPRNAIAAGPAARLTPGFAWFLPGAGSGTGIGEHETLTVSQFSGPTQINRAVHLAGGELELDVLADTAAQSGRKAGSQATLCCWFWLGERSGASQRSGSLCTLPGGDALVAHQDASHEVSLEWSGQQTQEKWRADDWHFLVMIRDGDRLAVHLDGSQQPVLTGRCAAPLNDTEGLVRWRLGSGLQGKLDEVALFDRGLSAEECTQLWELSGIARQRAREAAERQQREREAAQRAQPPAFPETYRKALANLSPIVLEPLAELPSAMQATGSIQCSPETYAQFRTGRLAGRHAELQTAFSVSLWFYNGLPNDARPVTGYFFSRGPDGDGQAPGDHLGIGGTYRANWSGRLLLFNGNARDQVAVGRTLIPVGTWNHVVLVRDGQRTRLWLNGESTPEIDAELDITAPGITDFYLGARSDQFAPLEGHLAYFALFPRALSMEEAQQLHAASGQPVGMPPGAAARGARAAKEPATTERVATGRVAPEPAGVGQPLSPSESLAGIHVPPGFRVELVAAEPQVIDPVAFDWDSTGRLWVVEMADYPLGLDGQGKPGGRVRVLEDRDGDGYFETSRLFAENLNFPNGIVCWRDGVIVTAAPHILWLRDTDGDGVADKRQVLLDGFLQGNQQLRVNGLRWGVDNWLYCASGGHHANYGVETRIRSTRARTAEPNTVGASTVEASVEVSLGSHDFRFRPETGEVEIESGPSQFGRNRNSWGDWFGTQNANPLWHYVISERYLARNPHVPFARPIQHVLPGGSPPVYPASSQEKRFHSFQEAGHFTSACGSTFYGDTILFGRSEKDHAFVCEPFHNLVQHSWVSGQGSSFTSQRPVGEGRFDFFASEDRWCRPVMARTGPDGGLWIADMVRYMIEHPEWLPPEGKAELLPHYRLGDTHGRIYRVVTAAPMPARAWPFPDHKPETLVAALDSSNDWQRDRAQQLLLERGDPATQPRLVTLLENLFVTLTQENRHPQARLQTLYTLDGLGGLEVPVLTAALSDPHPRVREHALRLAEGRDMLGAIAPLVDDPDAKVRLQLALTLGEFDAPAASRALVRLASRDFGDPFMVTAVLSSSLMHSAALTAGLLEDAPAGALDAFYEPLIRQALAREDDATLALLLERGLAGAEDSDWAALERLLYTLQRFGADLKTLGQRAPQGRLAQAAQRTTQTLEACVGIASDARQTAPRRMAAARLLCRSPQHAGQGVQSLAEWLRPQHAPQIQQQVLAVLQESGSAAVPEVLAKAWPEFTPEVRGRAVDVWLSRAVWADALLERIESEQVAPASLEPAQRGRLLQYPQASVAERAQRTLNSVKPSPRLQVVSQYAKAIAAAGEDTGDPAKGRAVYMRACASCHRLGDAGYEVGPNLATVIQHTTEKLLTNILHPNADIQPGYQAYICLLEDGEILSGLLTGETAGSVTLKLAGGAARVIARSEIVQLKNTNVSLMPEGLEMSLTEQEMLDLLAFLHQPVTVEQR